MKQIDISTPEAVNALITQLREVFPTPTRSTMYCHNRYCVAGSFCKFIGANNWSFPPTPLAARALTKVNPFLRDGDVPDAEYENDCARRFAKAIIDANDLGNFDLAYDRLRDALNFRHTNED